MAKFKGTNGNDTIIGTDGDDTIVPLLGQDSVDGGAGYDTLTVDYSSLADAYWYSTLALTADGSWSGAFTGGSLDAQNFASFQNVEQVKFTATQADDYLTVDLGTLTPDKSRLNLNGSDGDDTLSVLGGQLTKRLTLEVGPGGAIKSNFAALAGWENYDIGLGLSAGNKLTLGGGDDRVSSLGGRDTIDGGAGTDTWIGQYDYSTDEDTSFFYTTATAVATVTVAGTQYAEIRNVESFTLHTGTGDDVVTLYGGAGSFNGGDGSDQIALNPFGAGAPMRYEVYQVNAATLAGQATVLGGGDPLNFYAYEDVILGGSEGADQFVVDLSKFQAADTGFAVDLAAKGGGDSQTLALAAQGAATIAKSSTNPGYGEVNWGSNHIGWRDVETANVILGAGDDLVDFNVAATALTIDGGAGVDTIDFSAATGGVQFRLDLATAQTAGGISITVKNVETLIGTNYLDYITAAAGGSTVYAGGGDDTVRSSASTIGVDTFDGGAGGGDGIDYTLALSGVIVSLAITAAQNTGGAGTDILTGFETLIGSFYNDVLTGSAGLDTINGYYGDDLLEGGSGNDSLRGDVGIDTASYASAGAAVTVSLNITAAQNTGGAGIDKLDTIENLTGSIYGDTLGGNASANRLSGGRGGDVLTGLGGADVFVFTSTLDSNASGYDRITDFSRTAGDKVDLSAIDAITSNFVRNDAFTWIGDAEFSGVAGQLREVSVRGGGGWWIYGDTNGDKTADLTIYVSGSTPLLPNSDIVL